MTELTSSFHPFDAGSVAVSVGVTAQVAGEVPLRLPAVLPDPVPAMPVLVPKTGLEQLEQQVQGGGMNSISYETYSAVRDEIEAVFIAAQDAMDAAAWLDREPTASLPLESKHLHAVQVLAWLRGRI